MSLAAAAALCVLSAPLSGGLAPLRITSDRRGFETVQGKPFFWLGDTGWTMTTRLTMEEIDEYLSDRKKKGFNVIQLILVPWDARTNGNLAGEKPYIDNDMAKPNPRYFDHVEKILDKIERRGFYPAVVPFWLAGLPEPEPVEVPRHEAYAKYLGKRFGHRPLIWLLGADRWPNGWADVIRAFAAQLEKSSNRSDLLLTHHPAGGQSSSRFFHAESWMDFNMLQSGHNADLPAYRLTQGDYAKTPVKPVLDGEAAYENITNALVQYAPGVRVINDYDVRRQAYQSVFHGAAGHTYGACEVYEFHHEKAGKARWTVGIHWREALQLPGAAQMGHLRRLIESRRPSTRVPDLSLIVSPNSEDPNLHLAALRDEKFQWAMVYTPNGSEFRVDSSRLKGNRVVGRWFDPRTGRFGRPFPVASTSSAPFTPPAKPESRDWVLLLEGKRS
jgi:hypothetical protein